MYKSEPSQLQEKLEGNIEADLATTKMTGIVHDCHCNRSGSPSDLRGRKLDSLLP